MKKENKTIMTTRYYLICPVCKRKISGNSESATQYNLSVHRKQKHELPVIKNKDMIKTIKQEVSK